MKYHSIFISAITSLCFFTATSSIAAVNGKNHYVKNARWFEIEVILFKHLGAKKQSKETFSDIKSMSKNNVMIDLITPYMQPDIASLKQLMPQCHQPSGQLPYDIKLTPLNLSPNITEYDNVSMGYESTIKLSSSEDYAAELDLPLYNQYPINSNTALCVIPQDFFAQHYSAEQLANFNSDAFPVKKITTTIDGNEQWQADKNDHIIWASDEPYLISQNSLRLKSIANRIKRYRSYQPLLHLGWRQPGQARNKATPMKLYAGKNLTVEYQQALANQTTQQQSLELKSILEQRQNQANVSSTKQMDLTKANINTLNNEMPFSDQSSIEQRLYLQAKQRQLNYLFEEFAELNTTETSFNNNKTNDATGIAKNLYNQEAVNGLVAQLSTDMDKQVMSLIDENNALEQVKIATAPLQPWEIDGFFKVHLDHYLYINSEFSIIDIAQGTEADNTVSFKQNRRVISGEIHYFDHPNIGMIVQIRRFDPTKPAALAVSQNKK